MGHRLRSAARALWRLSALGLVVAAGCSHPTRPPAVDPATSPIPSTAVISTADLDSTLAPCHDFHQYATGGWYRHTAEKDREETAHGPDQMRAALALRQLVRQSPALARTTTDPTLRTVGYFFGSCLRDTTGAAQGAIGDTTRASNCFRRTREVMDRALFELLMEYVWTPAARAENRRFWDHMKAAAIARVEASLVLPDTAKRHLTALTAALQLHASEAVGAPWGWDSTTEFWRRDVTWPSGMRGPSDPPFSDPRIARTWSYRNYAELALSPTDFRKNVTQLHATPDTVPLPLLPTGKRQTSKAPAALTVLDVLLGDKRYEAGVKNGAAGLPLGMMIIPMVNGKIDIGAWYGMIGPVTGHEMSHGTLRGGGQTTPLTQLSEAQQTAFAAEQFRRQLQHFSHPFDDSFGALIAYDAFKRAIAGRSWPSIDGFTPEQRFFLGVARGWRGGPMSISPIDNSQTRWQVLTNGTLSTMRPFAIAFGCMMGDDMIGRRVWYQEPWQGTALSAGQWAQLAQSYDQMFQLTASELRGAQKPLTAEQDTVLRTRRQAYDTERRAVFGGPTMPPAQVGSYASMYRLLGKELGAVRTVLTPAEQATFDTKAREWMQQRRVRGITADIPGIQP